ncbi:MAG: hypothetical protein VX276_02940 [Pseudomonadota bacterium]|nr:hypothetical protein [Pseudomonadota bacterium]
MSNQKIVDSLTLLRLKNPDELDFFAIFYHGQFTKVENLSLKYFTAIGLCGNGVQSPRFSID